MWVVYKIDDIMRRVLLFIVAALALSVSIFVVGCGPKEAKRIEGILKDARDSGLKDERDSLSYVVGLNIASQLQKMDSTINVNVVCRAILEHVGGDAIMNLDEARDAYLRYLLFLDPERKRGYEEQYLADLVKNNRTFTRTNSGLTYHIEVIGDEKRVAKNNNDWVVMSYTITRVSGEQLYPKESGERATLALGVVDMVDGVAESVKMVGRGGKIQAWLPSKIAYGEEGSAELGISPIETLLYDIEIVDMEANVARTRKQEPKRF